MEKMPKERRRRAAAWAESMSCPFLLGADPWMAPRRVGNHGQRWGKEGIPGGQNNMN